MRIQVAGRMIKSWFREAIEVGRHLIYGDWSWGCKQYPNKPQLSIYRDWYDGWHYVLHIGPLHVCVHY